jgi:FkbM family methyltransferase
VIQFVKDLIRRRFRSAKLYAYARRAMLLAQYYARRPDEEDLRAFAVFADRPGPVLDCGANAGQSAIAFAFILPDRQIVSFEPNPAMWSELEFVSRRIGARHRIYRAGVGAASGRLPFFIPMIDALPVTTQASLDREQTSRVSERLARDYGGTAGVEEVPVEIAALDDLEFMPAMVKIDVEGGELDVLKGMERLLRECRPVLMVEALVQKRECQEFLTRHAYRFAYWHAADKCLRAADSGSRNWFAVPAEDAAKITG